MFERLSMVSSFCHDRRSGLYGVAYGSTVTGSKPSLRYFPYYTPVSQGLSSLAPSTPRRNTCDKTGAARQCQRRHTGHDSIVTHMEVNNGSVNGYGVHALARHDPTRRGQALALPAYFGP